MSKKIASAISKLGTVKYDGSGLDVGRAYHELPFNEIALPTHRKKLQNRVAKIVDAIDVSDNSGRLPEYGVDLGCSVGGVTFSLQLAGAQATGIDYDRLAIEVAQACEAKYCTGAKFICAEITEAWLNDALPQIANPNTGKLDFCVWLSQFMWMAKQQGPKAALSFLRRISNVSDVLFFESSQGDFMAGGVMKEMGVTSKGAIHAMLEEVTEYSSIVDLGQAHDGWAIRHMFLCQ